MNWEDAFKIIAATITSIGAGGAIVFALASWLGKVWAERILLDEKNRLSAELERTKQELDLIKEKTLRFQNDKIFAYRAVSDVVARMLATFDSHEDGRLTQGEAGARFDEFNEQRIKVYGHLAMMAPQAVMNAQDELMDYLLLIYHGNAQYDWEKIREKALSLLNEIRLDIGIDKSPIAYNGKL